MARGTLNEKPKLFIHTKPATERIATLFTMGYLIGCLSKSEEDWLRHLVVEHWADKPPANSGEFGE